MPPSNSESAGPRIVKCHSNKLSWKHKQSHEANPRSTLETGYAVLGNHIINLHIMRSNNKLINLRIHVIYYYMRISIMRCAKESSVQLFSNSHITTSKKLTPAAPHTQTQYYNQAERADKDIWPVV